MNPRLQDIYDLIKKSIEDGNGLYTTITNTEISKELDISAFTIRDKVIELYKKGHIIKKHNFWTKDRKFYQRVIYLK